MPSPASPPIPVLRTVAEMRRFRAAAARPLALVPTMGALHEGHLGLARAAAAACPTVVVSIFVNPAQFGPAEDLGSYPATFAADLDKLGRLNAAAAAAGLPGTVAAVFAPADAAELYPSGFPGQEVGSAGSFVSITPLGAVHEGASRPTFFRGVATVCMKLFNLVGPDEVFFGQKDYQQSRVVRRMLADFFLDARLRIGATVRDARSGLALSSRNVYLGPARTRLSAAVPRALAAVQAAFAAGERAVPVLRQAGLAVLAQPPPGQLTVDYLTVADPDSLEEVPAEVGPAGAVVLLALLVHPLPDGQANEAGSNRQVRLIDNLLLGPAADGLLRPPLDESATYSLDVGHA